MYKSCGFYLIPPFGKIKKQLCVFILRKKQKENRKEKTAIDAP